MSVRSWGLGFSNADGVTRPREFVQRACDALTAASGLRLVPFVAQSYDDLTAAVAGGEVAFAWLPPIPAIELYDQNVAEPLVVASREGDSTYRSAVVVRPGTVEGIGALRGRRVAWVSPESASGYIVPRVYIAAEGHDILHFFGSEVFLHDHRAVIEAVARGDVDCGATYCSLGPDGRIASGSWLADEGRSGRPLEALATYGPIPGDAIVAATSVPAHARLSVTRYLLDVTNEDQVLTKLLRTKSLRIATRDHFDSLRHVLRTARARGYAALPPKSRRAIRVL
jgi:phosphonate transport system substrate-binding protein